MLPRATGTIILSGARAGVRLSLRWHHMKLIKYDVSEQDIVRRIVTAVIAEWDGLPSATRDGLLREACLATDASAKPKTSLREEIAAFIRKHADTQRGPTARRDPPQ
jgi:hypothetical protein